MGAGGRLGALSIYGTGRGRNGLTTVAKSYYKAFGPKLGFAYSINPKTVFRGSYGISYLPLLPEICRRPVRQGTIGRFHCYAHGRKRRQRCDPGVQLEQWLPPDFSAISYSRSHSGQWREYRFIDRNDNRPSMVQNIGAEMGRELPGGVSLRVGYVGTMTHGVWGSYDMSSIPLSALQYGSLLTQSINSPAAQTAGIPLPYPGFTGSVAQALRPYPQYLGVTNMDAQVGTSTYHALQINAQRQFGSLVFLANFTASKQLCSVPMGGWTGFGFDNAQHPALDV